MERSKWGLVGLAVILLMLYNGAQPDLLRMRTMGVNDSMSPGLRKRLKKEQYGPSMQWLDRLMNASSEGRARRVKLDFSVLSSMMVAGLASGFKSQVANLLWMKSDEYWHEGLFTRQVPLMEAVVTLDPEFVDAWSTAGWHWAYNIYADLPNSPRLKKNPKLLRHEQEEAITTGLDYLRRGSEMNPDTYRLWFEHGWTRAEKAGIYDGETVELYRTARSKGDARDIVKNLADPTGRVHEVKVKGLDIMGRTIGHLYEKIPDLDRALDLYGRDLLQATPRERALLDAAGEYWHRYGSDYTLIAAIYRNGDATVKSQVKQLVPDVERLVHAQQMRESMDVREGKDQPTGAYITISARYMEAWKLEKQGNLPAAITNIIGVMNADPRYHLQGLPVLGKVLEIRGDAPEAVKAQLDGLRKMEKDQTQDIGLHFLAKLYEESAAKATDPQQRSRFNRLAYETWYRARERDNLDYYARRNTLLYEDKFGFTPPQDIIARVKASRNTGSVEAAPPMPKS